MIPRTYLCITPGCTNDMPMPKRTCEACKAWQARNEAHAEAALAAMQGASFTQADEAVFAIVLTCDCGTGFSCHSHPQA